MPEIATPRRTGIEGDEKRLPLLREYRIYGTQEAAGLTTMASPPPGRMIE